MYVVYMYVHMYVCMYIGGTIWVVYDFKQEDCFLQVCTQYVTPLCIILRSTNSAFFLYNKY